MYGQNINYGENNTKILFVLFLSLLIAASAIAADTDYSGTWYMHYFSTDGEDMITVSDLGMYSEMTLNEDGTAVMTITNGDEENSAEGTWKAEAEGISATIDGGTQTGVIQDGFLLFDTGDDGMLIFGREEPEPAFELADPDEEAKAEDYEGTWLAYKVGMEEVGYFDWDMVAPELGVDTNEIEIKDGVMTIFGNEDKPTTLTFEEGGVMADRMENREYANLDTVVTLREDGTLTLDYMTMVFVLEKAEE